MNVLVVTPTYNERENLPLLAAGVLKHDGFRLLVVDDGSPDGSGAIADGLARDHPGRVEVIHRTGVRGLGRSYIDGLLHAIAEGQADFICQMDCDLSHDPENWPIHRILLSAFGNRYIRFVTNLAASDCTSGYRCWRRESLARLPIAAMVSDGYAFLVEMLYEAKQRGFRIGEVPIIFVERRLGQSKLSSNVLLESLIMPWRLVFRGRS